MPAIELPQVSAITLNEIMEVDPESSMLPSLVALLQTSIKDMETWADDGELEDELDYHLERLLEHTEAIADTEPEGFISSLKGLGLSPADIVDMVSSKWLYLADDISGITTKEIKIRAAELLGTLAVVIDEDEATQLERLKSDKYEVRMWGARALRALQPDGLEDMLAALENDPYEDDDGIFPVREAAGFMDE